MSVAHVLVVNSPQGIWGLISEVYGCHWSERGYSWCPQLCELSHGQLLLLHNSLRIDIHPRHVGTYKQVCGYYVRYVVYEKCFF